MDVRLFLRSEDGQRDRRDHGRLQGDPARRRTYELFAPAWSTRTAADDPGAPFINDTPKYVVSSTLRSADWRNSSVLGRTGPRPIGDLKRRVDGGIYVSGSGTLVRAMLADGFVDELHLYALEA